MKLKNPMQAGFTLIELVIVIVIIGILAAVALPNFLSISQDAHITHANNAAGAIAQQVAFDNQKCLSAPNTCFTGTRNCARWSGSLPATGDYTWSLGGTTAACTVIGTQGTGSSAASYTSTVTFDAT